MSISGSIDSLRILICLSQAIPDATRRPLLKIIDNILSEVDDALDKEFLAGIGSKAIAKAFGDVGAASIIKAREEMEEV